VTSFRTVCTTQAASALASGALLLVLPWPVLALFSLPTEPGTQIVARILGGVLFALGATLLGARDVEDPSQRLRILLGNAVCDGSVAVLLLASVATGTLTLSGAGLALLFAVNAGTWLLVLRSR
jgi:hypothetical protein